MSKKIYDEDINMLVPWFLMASYAYYKLGVNIMPDSEFDRIARNLKKHWDNVDHMHKHLITKEMLSTQSGYSIEYTTMIKHATMIYIESLTARQYKKFQTHVKQK
jgi:NAD-dependent DNA ligase